MKPVMINTTEFPELEKSLTQEGWGNPLWSKELLEKYWGKPAEIWQHFCNWRTACKMKKGKGKGACIWLLTNIWQAACKDYHSLAIEFNRLQQERDTLHKECQNLDTRVRTLNRDMEHLQKRLLPLIEKEGIERREKLETKTRSINRAKVETALWLDPEEWDGDIWDSADESPSSEEEGPSVKLRPAITHHKSEEHEENLSGAELDEEGDDNYPSTSSKTKKGGKKGKGSKAPTHFTKITTRQYTPMELKTIQGDFAKKPEEGIIEWLVRLWDTGGGYIRLTAQETERLNLGAGIFLEHSEGNTPKTLWSLACRWARGIYPADRDEPTVMHWTNIDEVKTALLTVAVISMLGQNPQELAYESPWEGQVDVDDLRPLLKGVPSNHRAMALSLRSEAAAHNSTFRALLNLLVSYFREFGDIRALTGKAKIRSLQGNKGAPSKGHKNKREPTQEEKELRAKLWRQCLALGYPRDVINGLPTERLKLFTTFKRADWETTNATPSAPLQLSPLSPPADTRYTPLLQQLQELPEQGN